MKSLSNFIPTYGIDSELSAGTIPTTGQLFLAFLELGVTAFGGALPLARTLLVENRRWLSATEFTDLLGLCQFLPGGNVINLSIAVGFKFRGWCGALVCLIGLVALPSVLLVGFGSMYEHFQNDPQFKRSMAGLAAAAAGLLIQVAVKMLSPLRRKPALACIALSCFICIAFFHVPLVLTVLIMTPLSIVLCWRRAND